MRSLLLAGVIVATMATPAAAQTGTITQVPGAEVVPGRYIVVLKDNATVAPKHPGKVRKVFRHALNGYSVEASEAEARRIAADPAVAYVQPDVRMHAVQRNPPSWGLDRVDQRYQGLDNDYTYNQTAAGVRAYVIDTGIRLSHSTFGGRATWGTNTLDTTNDDCDGHGTHVAGTLGGREFGVAKDVRLVAVKVLGCDGSGSNESVIAGIDWVTANAVRPAVANMSIGYNAAGVVNPAVDDAVRRSIASGITYSISANNLNADSCRNSPSRVTEALIVGATDRTDNRASFSNFGPCVDLFAPGVDIVSAGVTSDTSTATMSGTSMAAPHVAGAAAQYLASNPGSTPQQIHDAIVRNSTPNQVKNAGTGSPNRLLYTGLTRRSSQRLAADFDGDRTADLAVWRPSNGTWYVAKSTGGQTVQQYGSFADDVPQAADFDGDGKADFALWRPSNGTWYVLRSSDGGQTIQQYGQANDIPVAADYDGDNRADLAVWRPSNGTWYVAKSSGGQTIQQYGSFTDDVPVVGNFRGDARADFTLWRPSNGTWYVLHSDGSGQTIQQYGSFANDVPVTGDMDGDRKNDFIIWRPSNGTWYALHSNGSGQTIKQYGSFTDDVPVAGYFDGDNRTDWVIWRPSNGTWYVLKSQNGGQVITQYGQLGDITV